MSPESPPDPPRLGTTRLPLLVILATFGLVVGRLLRPLELSGDLDLARVTYTPGLVLLFVAALLAGTARATARTIREGRYLPPHQAVNRLVLGKSSALVGSVLAGIYLGVAWGWTTPELNGSRVLPALLAVAGAALMMTAALLLERACRRREPPDSTATVV